MGADWGNEGRFILPEALHVKCHQKNHNGIAVVLRPAAWFTPRIDSGVVRIRYARAEAKALAVDSPLSS